MAKRVTKPKLKPDDPLGYTTTYLREVLSGPEFEALNEYMWGQTVVMNDRGEGVVFEDDVRVVD